MYSDIKELIIKKRVKIVNVVTGLLSALGNPHATRPRRVRTSKHLQRSDRKREVWTEKGELMEIWKSNEKIRKGRR